MKYSFPVNKCILLILMLLMLSPMMMAQSLSVTDFKARENDLTANTHGTMERDQNGEVAALIRVQTTQQGFVFSGGMMGIVKTKQGVGEIWVYVPHGIKKLEIRHQQLGSCEYSIPIPIEKARTYEMTLSTGQVQTIVNHQVNKQFVIINVQPADALVEINGEIFLPEEGVVEQSLPFGKYTYRVSSEDYHPQAGVFTVDASGKVEMNVQLKPHFGWIHVDGDAEYHGAMVYLGNERLGTVPFTSKNMKSGDYQLRIMKTKYKTQVLSVHVSDNQTTEIQVALQPNFATVNITAADEACEIWIDNEFKAKASWTGALSPGEYKLEARKEGHQSVSELLTISDLSPRQVQLSAPLPLYGSMELTSAPTKAKVYMDGQFLGETPLMTNDILVGTHQLRFEKELYETASVQAVVKHNQTFSHRMVLKKIEQPQASLSASLSPSASPSSSVKPAAKPQKVRAAKNRYYKNFSFYAGAYLTPVLSTERRDEVGYVTAQVGTTIKSINLEYNYSFVPDDFIQQKYDLRLGYALPLGRSFLLTPQVGYEGMAGFSLEDGVYKNLYQGLLLACRTQVCLSKGFALALTPSYALSGASLSLQAGLVFNFSLAK